VCFYSWLWWIKKSIVPLICWRKPFSFFACCCDSWHGYYGKAGVKSLVFCESKLRLIEGSSSGSCPTRSISEGKWLSHSVGVDVVFINHSLYMISSLKSLCIENWPDSFWHSCVWLPGQHMMCCTSAPCSLTQLLLKIDQWNTTRLVKFSFFRAATIKSVDRETQRSRIRPVSRSYNVAKSSFRHKIRGINSAQVWKVFLPASSYSASFNTSHQLNKLTVFM